jgi:hypothetical protein
VELCERKEREGMKRVRECVYSAELDLQTLVWTRGRDFPLVRLENRLKCPRCRSRRVRLAFMVLPTRQAIANRAYEVPDDLSISS